MSCNLNNYYTIFEHIEFEEIKTDELGFRKNNVNSLICKNILEIK